MIDLRDNLLACRLALWHISGIGPLAFHQMEQEFSDLREIFTLPVKQLKDRGVHEKWLSEILTPNWQQVETDLLWQQQPSHHIISRNDHTYPALLKEIPAAPPILFVIGDVSLLSAPQIAIIGSRNPSHIGKENAFQFAAELARSNYCITSGLALGIDSSSHQGALKANGKTIAVLGTGIDVIYPKSNMALAKVIAEQGAIISEFPRSAQPLPQHFPRRNRIISGLSLGVLVVEAALKSGSLITARYAIEQNRDVFAIPGSIHNPLAKGCHELIRHGAKLVETAQQINEELMALTTYVTEQSFSSKFPEGLDKRHLKLVKCIEDEVTSMDELLMRSGLSIPMLTPLLLDLELKGVIISVPGGYTKA